MRTRSLRIAPLLFCSGLCALIYQIVWLRELRHVFGASTPASAAVLAVFMGGLGLGSHHLGPRADRTARPLRMYAWLEGGIALAAAVSPLLLDGARALYVHLGGAVGLGIGGATAVRLLLSAVVLLPATFLMGGTLPAAARAATLHDDVSRQSTALLYGVNTLGAVLGATLATFVMLEVFGVRFSLWMACALNGLVAVLARATDRSLEASEPPADAEPAAASESDPDAPPESGNGGAGFVWVAAAGVGLSFLLMELVWYRVLSPLLGGSSYTFGLILAVALAGIGVGGLAYTLGRRGPPTFAAFAITCVLEALCMVVPYALGDRVALLALFLRDFGVLGLAGHVLGWTVVTTLVVFPAAVISGYQFPLLIGLLGRAQRGLGGHVGRAYAANTLGAIVGSLAGGFLLPQLGALGAWKLAVWLLLGLGAAALVIAQARRPQVVAGPALVATLAVLGLYGTQGPTAVWRHSPIGAGRGEVFLESGTINGLRGQMAERRRGVSWEADGRESTLAIYDLNDAAFLVNGKSDGSAVLDGGTQVMGGVLGALLQPTAPRRALVIGLGTGSTAGWLAALPSIERVDVVELEPQMVHVARRCAKVNRDVLNDPKVNLIIGDAREVLLTTPERYDLVFSEPSNPYRAGVASLFTQELYRAVEERLEPGGVFLQWLQAYEIDARSVRIVYNTLHSVLPSVESWRTKYNDLLLVARRQDEPFDVARVRARMREPGYAEALLNVWRAERVEDVVSHFVARSSLAAAIAERDGPAAINTDDRNQLEFSIARALGRPPDFNVDRLRDVAALRQEERPLLVGELDWERVYDAGVEMRIPEQTRPLPPRHLPATDDSKQRRRALLAWFDKQPERAIAAWEQQERVVFSPVSRMAMADAYAQRGRDEALALVKDLPFPAEAHAIEARYWWTKGERARSWQALDRALAAFGERPWADNRLLMQTTTLLYAMADHLPQEIPAMLARLDHELGVGALRYLREDLRLELELKRENGEGCAAAIEAMGPDLPWERSFLARRVKCYTLAGHPLLAEAEADYARFMADAGTDFAAGLVEP